MEIKDCQSKSDEELVVLTLQDKENFLCLMKRYEDKLLRYILRISSFSVEEAEDVLQEVFIKTYQNLNDFDTSLKFSSWIYRITHNQVVSNFRKTKSRPQNVSLFEENDFLQSLISDIDTEKEISLKYLKKDIISIIDKLDPKYKEVLVLKFLEEKDYREISDILKKPVGTVGSLINRAKQQFKKEAENQGIKF